MLQSPDDTLPQAMQQVVAQVFAHLHQYNRNKKLQFTISQLL
jgi:type III secretion system FlhB-like substrate exporter